MKGERMTNEQVSNFQAALEERLMKIESEVAEFRVELTEALEVKPTFLQDGMDHAKIEGDLNTRIEIHELKMDLKRQLFSALKKNRGWNLRHLRCCGDKIDVRRLEAQPTASLCLNCQELAEASAPIIQQPIHSSPMSGGNTHWVQHEKNWFKFYLEINERMCGVKLLKLFSLGLKRVFKKLWEKMKAADQRAYLVDQRFNEMRQKMREKYYFCKERLEGLKGWVLA